jgi:hypothetical protein
MMSYWLDKMLGADDDGNNFTKLVPLVIIFVIWVVGAISKAAQKGKKGTETESEPPEESEGTSFDDLARKIRERYAEAKEQAKIEAQQGGNEQFQPPARTPQPKPPPLRRPEPTPAKKPIAPPMYAPEGPTLKVVKGLQNANVGDHLEIEKPTLQKVEPDLHKVDALTSENAKVSSEVEVIHHQYLLELAEQYATADGFRKAILNYEILGSPVSLRCAVDTQNEAF